MRVGRGLLRVALGLALLLALQNALLNFAIPRLLNLRPERLRVDYTSAWMWIPGDVSVRGLSVRIQGRADQVLVTADEASADVAVLELFERRFRADAVTARGVSLRHRRRLDVDTGGEAPLPAWGDPVETRAEADTTAPIPGLSNPPDPDPDTVYPPRGTRWLVRLDDIRADDVREIWIGGVHLTGLARLAADVSIADPYIDIVGAMSILGMQADIGDRPLASDIAGHVAILLDSLDRKAPDDERLAAITARARLEADVEDLRFLDFYLAAVPWLSFSGLGHARLDVGLDEGQLLVGSTFAAEFPDLLVRVLHNDIIGAGRTRAEIRLDSDGLPQSHVAVDFDSFAVRADGTTGALIEGSGFRLEAESPDVSLTQPLSAVDVVIDLPTSRVPDLTLYNTFMPVGVGLSLQGGAATVRAHLIASSVNSRASGDVWLTGDDVEVRLTPFTITGDMELHGRLADADLVAGHYDLAGSSLILKQVGLIDQGNRAKGDRRRDWSATLNVSTGTIQVGAPVFLNTTVRMTCRDSTPFVRLFVKPGALPRWAQERLSVPHLSGSATLAVGEDTLAIAPARIRSGNYQLDLRYYRTGPAGRGELLVAAGPLALGVALRASGPKVHVLGATNWFYGRDRRSRASK